MPTHWPGWPTQTALELIEARVKGANRPVYLGELSLDLRRGLEQSQVAVSVLVVRGLVARADGVTLDVHGMRSDAVAYVWVGGLNTVHT